MDPTWKAVFLTAALVVFAIAAWARKAPWFVNTAAGLALAAVPFVWDAWEAA